MRTALQEGSESEEEKVGAGEAVEVKVALYNDCIAAMVFLLDKERGFHRVRHAVARYIQEKGQAMVETQCFVMPGTRAVCLCLLDIFTAPFHTKVTMPVETYDKLCNLFCQTSLLDSG